ncbi:MAG: extracellular solute-binding protein [Phycisphaerae bacterium]
MKLRIAAPPKSLRGPMPAADRAVLDAYLARHPEVRIDPYVQLRMQGPRAEATFYMSMAGESAPDALYVYERSMQKYIDQRFLYPLNEYLYKPDGTPTADGREIVTDPLFQKLLPAITRGGKIYGIPAIGAVHALLYRKDLFQQAGLDPERPPATWEELMDYARKLTWPQRGQFGFMVPGGGGAGWRWSNFVWQAGGDIVRQKPDGSWMLSLTQPRLMMVLRLASRQAGDKPAKIEVFQHDGTGGEAWAASTIEPSLVEIAADGAWRLTSDEPGVIKVFQQADGQWTVDKLPGMKFSKEWTAEGFLKWAAENLPEDKNKEVPPAIRALEFYREMKWGRWTRDDKQMPGCMRIESSGESSMDDFNQGKVAMVIVSTTGDLGRYVQDPSQVGLGPLPAGPELAFPDPVRPNDPTAVIKSRLHATMLEGEFWGINSLISADKARRDACWDYIRFLVSDEARAIRTRVYVESGAAASVNPKWLQKYGYQAELRLMPREWLEFYDKVLVYGQLEPYAPGYDQVATDVMSAMDDVLLDERGVPRTVLKNIDDRANSAFFGTTPPDVMRDRRVKAWAVACFMLAVAIAIPAWWLSRWWRQRKHVRDLLRASGGRMVVRRGVASRLQVIAWAFLAPAVLTILIWAYWPLLRGAALAFQDYRILGNSSWVALDNFIEAFNQREFWRAFGQTAIYAGMSLSIGFFIPIILAFLLSEIPLAKMFFRTVFYLPAVTSGLVVMFIWKMMYDQSGQGVFNAALAWLTGPREGRIALLATLLAIWALAASLLAGVAATWVRRYEGQTYWGPIAVLAGLAAVCWFDVLGGAVAGLWQSADASWLRWLSWLNVLGARWELSSVVLVALRMLVAVVGLIAALLALLLMAHRAGRDIRRPAVRLSLILGVLIAVPMGIGLWQLINPQDQPYPFLQDPSGYWAMLWIILPGIWAGAGPGCIIYLAAIKSIPEELYEAADVDGAGPLEKAYHVTLQYLKPLIIINFVGAFVGTFHAMENVLVMTGGGPSNKTMTIGMDIFFNAFTHLKFGYATAEAWVLGSLLIGFTIYQLRILKKLRFTRAT